jgi:hypothetical protein
MSLASIGAGTNMDADHRGENAGWSESTVKDPRKIAEADFGIDRRIRGRDDEPSP